MKSTVLKAAVSASALSAAALSAGRAAPVETPKRRRGLLKARAETGNVGQLLTEMQQAFAEFKAANEQALKGKADTLDVEKLEKTNAALLDLQAELDKVNMRLAAAGTGDGEASAERKAHRAAFNTWFRRGREPESMVDLQIKAGLTTESDPDGGYLVPTEMESTIDRVLGSVSVFRSLANVRPIGTKSYTALKNMGGASSGWVGEEEDRPETDTPTLREIEINVHELYANPFATQTMLDDAQIDIEAWLADEVQIEFAEQEGAAFIGGDGVKKPRGLLAYPTVANASYAWGKIGFVASGGAAGFAAADPADALIDLYYALKSGYRNGAAWLTSDAVMGTIRKFKDGQGNYLWAPPTGADMPATILGKPVYTDDNMDALGAGKFPVAFGNYKRAYLIVDRMGIRVLRDPYTKKPKVGFYTTKRVGGGVVNFEAVKLLKCST